MTVSNLPKEILLNALAIQRHVRAELRREYEETTGKELLPTSYESEKIDHLSMLEMAKFLDKQEAK